LHRHQNKSSGHFWKLQKSCSLHRCNGSRNIQRVLTSLTCYIYSIYNSQRKYLS
jgi:hypothetical protein